MKVPIWCLNHMPVVLDGTPSWQIKMKLKQILSMHNLQDITAHFTNASSNPARDDEFFVVL